ncbi:hypothetical protein KW795_02055 [Candidatus Microgenomates bacterium]|nr:hypothetical protein [Candidatus Microgenomates bacterium]
MQTPQLTVNLEKFMAIVVATLFVLTTLLMVFLYSHSNNIYAQSLEFNKNINYEKGGE